MLKFAQRDVSLLGGTPSIPDTRTQAGSRRAHPRPKRHQVTKPNPHLGISLTSAILNIALLLVLIMVPIMAIGACVSFFLDGQSYQALGPLGPLLSLALITVYGFMYRVDIEDTKYSGPWII